MNLIILIISLTLDSCLHYAEQNNWVVRNAQLEVAAAEAQKGEALAAYFPQVSAAALGYHALHPMLTIDKNDIVFGVQSDNPYVSMITDLISRLDVDFRYEGFQKGSAVGLTLVQPIYAGGRIVTGNKLAKLGYEAALLKSAVARRTTVEEVENAYWQVVQLQEKRKTLQGLQLLLDTLSRDVESAYSAGLVTENDRLQIKLKKGELRSGMIQVDNGIRLSRLNLFNLIGIENGDSVNVVWTELREDEDSSVGKLPEEELLDMQVRAKELERRMTIGEALPSVMLGATYGYSHLNNRSQMNGVAGVMVNIPITDWGKTARKMQRQQAGIEMAKNEGLDDVFVHCFMDGRDVNPQAGINYVNMIQAKMDELHFGHIADIGGRYWGMDRDKNMDRVDVAYRCMVDHDAPSFTDYEAFFKAQYEELPKMGKEASDEFLIPHYNANCDGRISDNDAIIFMNYRPDRAIQISTLFTNPMFYQNPPKKEDGTLAYKAYVPSHPLKNIFYVCTMKYADSVNGKIAFELPKMTNIFGVWLAENGYTQLRIAETEKYAHVTFFFDATMNFDGVERPELKNCTRVLINSPKVATYDMQPEMSAYKVLDALMKELDKDYLDVVILNFANCDMVGHTAVHDSVVKAVEVVDECVGKIIDWCDANGATLIVTADHGNAEEILDENGKPFTAHTTNLVPFCINRTDIKLVQEGGKLANIAPTIIDLLGAKKPEEMSEESLIIHK